MIKRYSFVFSVDSLAAPVRLDTGLCAVIPAWQKLNQHFVDQSILQERPLGAIASHPRLALVCHAYNVAPSFLKLVSCAIDICRPSAIVFTTDCTDKKALLLDFLEQQPFAPPKVKVVVLPNIGRDVIPFWHALKEISSCSDVFLKLHWKESPHLDCFHPQEDGRKASDVWSNDIFKTLLPSSRGELEEILSLFAQDICCIYPRPWPPVSDIHWHSIENLEHFSQLLTDLSLPVSLSILPLVYPLGNMFYGSVSFFAKFADFFIERLISPPEPIADDGTMLHANERIYTFLAASHGLDVAAIYPTNSIVSNVQAGQSLSSVRRAIVFPVSSLVDSSASQCNLSLPVLHFSVISNSIRPLTSSHCSEIPLKRMPFDFLIHPFGSAVFRVIRALRRRIVAKIL